MASFGLLHPAYSHRRKGKHNSPQFSFFLRCKCFANVGRRAEQMSLLLRLMQGSTFIKYLVAGFLQDSSFIIYNSSLLIKVQSFYVETSFTVLPHPLLCLGLRNGPQSANPRPSTRIDRNGTRRSGTRHAARAGFLENQIGGSWQGQKGGKTNPSI